MMCTKLNGLLLVLAYGLRSYLLRLAIRHRWTEAVYFCCSFYCGGWCVADDESIGLKWSSLSITAMAAARIVRKNVLRCWNGSAPVAVFVIALGRIGETASRDNASSRLLLKVAGWKLVLCVDFMVLF
jgi:hypothetical protein